eukprot:scaffold2408_cov386-Prasinococcus_capsulatus_cf.AAC.18
MTDHGGVAAQAAPQRGMLHCSTWGLKESGYRRETYEEASPRTYSGSAGGCDRGTPRTTCPLSTGPLSDSRRRVFPMRRPSCTPAAAYTSCAHVGSHRGSRSAAATASCPVAESARIPPL